MCINGVAAEASLMGSWPTAIRALRKTYGRLIRNMTGNMSILLWVKKAAPQFPIPYRAAMADKSFRTRGSESLPAALPVRVAASSRAITPVPPLPYSQPTKIPNQLQTLARPDRKRLKPLTRKLLSTQKKTIMQTAVQHNSSHSSHFAPTPTASLSPTQAQVAAALARGLSVSAAGRQAGVHRTTIHHWFRSEPQFGAAVQNASREYIAAFTLLGGSAPGRHPT